MAAMVDVIERAFRVKAAGEVRMPHKAMITWADEPGTEERDGRIMAMPAYVGGEFDVAGLKWIPSVPDNPARNGLPRANALVLLTSRATGLPLAVMDGTVVSAMRTGAVTGVALRHLADPGTRVACLLGAGVLAHTQLEALRVVLPDAARGAGLRPGRRTLRAVLRARRARRRAAWTCGRRPRPRTRCAAPAWSCPRPWRSSRASPPAGSTRARPWCSSRAWTGRSTCRRSPTCWSSTTGSTSRPTPAATPQRLVAAGLVPADGSGAVELADVVTGRHPGAPARTQRIVVTPVGLAMDDVAAAWHVLRGARSRGLGTPLRLRSGPPAWE